MFVVFGMFVLFVLPVVFSQFLFSLQTLYKIQLYTCRSSTHPQKCFIVKSQRMSRQLEFKRKRVLYSPQKMAMAIHMVRTTGMSKKSAAKTYGVPRSTLQDKLSGRVPEQPTRPGSKSTFTAAEEARMVLHINKMATIGYPIYKKQLLVDAKRIVDADGRRNAFANNMPG
jgi:hypothetical protein